MVFADHQWYCFQTLSPLKSVLASMPMSAHQICSPRLGSRRQSVRRQTQSVRCTASNKQVIFSRQPGWCHNYLHQINEHILGDALHQVEAKAMQLPVTPDSLPGGQGSFAQHLTVELELTFLRSHAQPAASSSIITACGFDGSLHHEYIMCRWHMFIKSNHYATKLGPHVCCPAGSVLTPEHALGGHRG